MDVYFFDSSGIVKHYVKEAGTAWVGGIVDPLAGNLLYLAEIAGVEVTSAIARRSRVGSLLAPAALARFRQDFAGEFQIVPISTALVADGMALAECHLLRGYDAVQLAAAIQVAAECRVTGLTFTLISADRELNAAALAEGLAVVDPNDHP